MEVQEICEKLDERLLDFFDILGQVYQEQAKLEQYMRDGFLNLSRARYSMGVKSVSALQLPDKEMTPLLTVDTVGEKMDVKFEFQKASTNNKKLEKDNDVRKRNVKNDSLSVETVGQPEDVTKAVDSGKGDVPSCVDPIKWFGLLVPQALRRSQSSFQEAAGLAVSVANLKQRLVTARQDYKILLKKKKELISGESVDK